MTQCLSTKMTQVQPTLMSAAWSAVTITLGFYRP